MFRVNVTMNFYYYKWENVSSNGKCIIIIHAVGKPLFPDSMFCDFQNKASKWYSGGGH